jgi:hypothetical protein
VHPGLLATFFNSLLRGCRALTARRGIQQYTGRKKAVKGKNNPLFHSSRLYPVLLEIELDFGNLSGNFSRRRKGMLSKGDLVRHPAMPAWGIGTVVKSAQGGNLLVKFDQGGDKLLHPAYAGLVKISDDDLLFLVIREVQIRKRRSVKTIRIIPVVKRMECPS